MTQYLFIERFLNPMISLMQVNFTDHLDELPTLCTTCSKLLVWVGESEIFFAFKLAYPWARNNHISLYMALLPHWQLGTG